MREPIRRTVDLCSVLNATARNQHYFGRMKECVEDARRADRLAAQQCRLCFYTSSRLGGAMCTTALCGLCGKEMHFGNTCTDALCKECAAGKRLCHHCGGDVEMRNRRKL